MLIGSLIRKEFKSKKSLTIIFIFITFVFCTLLATSLHLNKESSVFLSQAYKETNQPPIMVAFLDSSYNEKYTKDITNNSNVTKSYMQTYYTGTFLQDNKDKEIIFFSTYDNKDFSKEKLPVLKNKEILLSRSIKNRYNLRTNQRIKLKIGNKKEKFIIKGFLSDPVFSSALSGQTRILVSKKEFRNFSKSYPHNAMGKYKLLSAYISPKSSKKKINNEISAFPDTTINYSFDTIKSNINLIPSIFIILLLVFSFFLFITIFIMIWYSISSTVNDNKQDFAILLSQGYTKRIITLNYMAKPLVMITISGVLGIFGEEISYNLITKYLCLLTGIEWGSQNTSEIAFITCFVIGFILCVFYLCEFYITFNAKPIDAIAQIKTKETKHLKAQIKISTISPKFLDATVGLNGFLTKLKQAGTLFLIVAILTFLMSVTSGILNLFSSNTNALRVLGANDGDIILLGKGSTSNIDDRLNKMVKKIKSNSKVSYYSLMDNKSIKIGDHNIPTTITNEFNEKNNLLAGKYPKNKKEILLSSNLAKTLNKKKDDQVELKYGQEHIKYKIAGIYQSIDNNGLSAKLSKNSFKLLDSEYVPKKAIVNLDTYNEKEINKIVSKHDNSYNINVQNGRASYISGVEYVRVMLTSVIVFILFITIIFSMLLVSMLVKITLTKEKKQFLIIESLGFSNRRIRNILIYRFLSVIVVSQIFGIILAVLLKSKLVSYILNFVGLTNVTVHLPLIYLVCTNLIILFVNAISITVTSRFSRKE